MSKTDIKNNGYEYIGLESHNYKLFFRLPTLVSEVCFIGQKETIDK